MPHPEATTVDHGAVARTSAAIQRQLVEDFIPMWEIPATIDFFSRAADVPLQYAPIWVVDRLSHPGVGGYHKLDNQQPFAVVAFDDPYWSVDASHECLEMIVDPAGENLVVGNSPDPLLPGRVQFLAEVCDPSGRENAAYQVDGV